MSLELLLRAHAAPAPATSALQVVTTTLDAMASGGIYDHLGGGFARYSVDERWLVPHFEKMLYDQALLVRVYLHAWQVTGEARYRQVRRRDDRLRAARPAPPGRRLLLGRGRRLARARRASSTSGRPTQVDAVARATSAGRRASTWYGVTEAGNFEGRTDPAPPGARRPAAAAGGRARPGRRCSRPASERVAARARRQGAHRVERADARRAGRGRRRARPRATGWTPPVANGRVPARRPAPPRRPLAALVAGRRRRPPRSPCAADHAALSTPSSRLAEATGEARWIDEARGGRRRVLDLFWDDDNGGLFTTGDDAEALIVRQKDLLDNATPSANSLAADGLLRLAALTGEQRYRHQAEQILQLVGGVVARRPDGLRPPAGRGRHAARRHHRDRRRRRPARPAWPPSARRYLPNAVLAWGEPLRLAAVGGPSRRARLRLPRLRLPGAGRLGRGPGRSARGLTT